MSRRSSRVIDCVCVYARVQNAFFLSFVPLYYILLGGANFGEFKNTCGKRELKKIGMSRVCKLAALKME